MELCPSLFSRLVDRGIIREHSRNEPLADTIGARPSCGVSQMKLPMPKQFCIRASVIHGRHAAGCRLQLMQLECERCNQRRSILTGEESWVAHHSC